MCRLKGPKPHPGRFIIKFAEGLCWDDVDAPRRHTLPVVRGLRLSLPLLQIRAEVLRVDLGEVGNSTHRVAASQEPVLMDDLVPAYSCRFRCGDSCEHLLPELASQALRGEAADLSPLFPGPTPDGISPTRCSGPGGAIASPSVRPVATRR